MMAIGKGPIWGQGVYFFFLQDISLLHMYPNIYTTYLVDNAYLWATLWSLHFAFFDSDATPNTKHAHKGPRTQMHR